VLEPEVLLLDEPTSALDPKSQSQVIDFLTEWSDGAKTIITATHDLDIIEDIADECLIFQHGRLVGSGEPHLLLKDEALLRRTNLLHAHRHAHVTGEIHSHPHLHHDHTHES